MINYPEFTLQLFNEGGAGVGVSAGVGASAENSNSGVGTQTVIYGKQEAQVTEPQAEDFESLIKGRYKEDFEKKTQSIIDRRFKQTKEMQKHLDSVNPIMDNLYAKYGVNPGDYQALSNAIDNDTAFFEQQAEAEGLTVEQYKHMKKMEAENNRFKAMQETQRREAAMQKTYNEWVQQATLLGIDLAQECSNPQFIQLLSAGTDMATAYKVCHFDDEIQTAVKEASKQVTDNIRAGQSRPTENGASSQPGIITKSNVSALSRADRAEIAKRVARGEKISF